VGDHGCEYMTGGRVVILGNTGKNFAAGMSGGVAYALDFEEKMCNGAMVSVEKLDDEKEKEEIRCMIEKHLAYTGSEHAKRILADWKSYSPRFKRIIPNDYKRMLENIDKAHKAGLSGEEALMVAFEENYKDVSRVSGN